MTQCGFAAFTRYLGPYYVILAAPLLAGMSAPALVPSVARKVGWRHWFWLGSAGVLALALLPLVLSPARPLWPAAMMLARLGGQHSPHPLVRRATTVYSVYRDRPEAFAPVFAVLPAQAEPLGLMTADDPEASLWRPFGHRRILYVCAGDTLADIRQRGIHYALVSAVVLENHHLTLEQWLAQVDAEVVQRLSLELRARTGPKEWFLVRFR